MVKFYNFSHYKILKAKTIINHLISCPRFLFFLVIFYGTKLLFQDVPYPLSVGEVSYIHSV